MSEQALELQITSNSTQAIQALKDLEKALNRIKTAVSGGLNFSSAAKQIDKLNASVQNAVSAGTAEHLNKIAFALDRMKAACDFKVPDFKNLEKVQKYAQSVSSRDTEKGTKDATNAIMQYGETMRELSSIQEQNGYSRTGNELRSYARQVKKLYAETAEWKQNAIPVDGIVGDAKVWEMGPVTTATDGMNQYAASVREAAAANAELADGVQRVESEIQTETVAASGLGARLRSAASGIRDYIRYVREAGKVAGRSSGFISNLVHSFGRIALYRAIRSAIKLVTDGFREGVENVRKYSEAIGGSFAQDMNNAAASLSTLKNSAGAALAPALQMIIPILNGIASAAITAFNALNQLLSLLRGGGSWTRATASMNGYTKAAKGAGGATKDLLADWDELNIIQSQGGGGGGGSDIDYTDMFEEVYEFDSKLKSIISWMQDHLDIVNATVAAIGAGFMAWGFARGFGMKLLDAAKFTLGIATAVLGTVYAFQVLKKQFDNGINWDNVTKAIAGSAIAVLGLALAFGKLGAGWGLLGVGIALAVNPIKELIETGKLSSAAMFQLALGLGAFAAGIALLATKSIPKAIKWFAGIALVVYGLGEAFKTVKQQLDEGVNYDNFLKLFTDLKIAAAGLLVLFGVKGLGAGLIASGIIEAIAPIKEFVGEINSGKDAISALRDVSNEAFAQLETGILEIGIGISLLTGNWIPLAIAGFVDIVLWVVREWDNIVDAFKRAWDGIGTWFYNTVTMPIGNFFIDMINSVLDTINTVITFINNTLGTSYELNNLIPRMEALKTEGEKGSESTAPESAGPKRKKNITGTATEDQLRGYTDAVQEVTEANKEAQKSQQDFAREMQSAIGDFDLSDYDNFEDALEAINNKLKENKDVLEEAAQQTIEARDSMSEYAEAAQEAAEAVGEQNPQSVVIPVEAQTVIQQTDDMVDFGFEYDAKTDNPIQLEAPVQLEGDVDTSNIEEVTENIRKALSDFNLFEDDTLDESMFNAKYFWDNTLSSMVDSLIASSGFTGPEADALKQLFYDKFMESLFDEEYEGDYDSPLNILKEAIEEPSEWIVGVPDTSALTNGLANAQSSVESYVAGIRAAIMSLNGVGFSFGWSGLSGGIRTVGMAAEGGLFTTGDMFIAREAGPELVGRMGNKSAVVNNDQIVQGIASGVASAQSEQNSLLRQQNSLLTALLNKKFEAEVKPSVGLGRVNAQSARMYERVSG